jgi:DNA-binding MarR family transcriptional regulator
VTRAICAEDRRGIYACITPDGRARYEAARPTHRRVLTEVLG